VRVAPQDQVAEEIRLRLGARIQAVIGIDGVQGVGKSTLAKNVAAQLGCKLLSLDGFLVPKQDCYVDAIRFDELRAAFGAATNSGGLVIIEGICLLSVLDRIGVRPDLLIYLKRRSDSGRWLDESNLAWEGEEEALVSRITEQTLRMRRAMAGRFGRTTDLPPSLRLEVAKYHFRYRPSEKADVTVDVHAD
jgi:hypothetical protein